MTYLRRASWPPYAVGALIGVLSWFAFWSADHPLGVSTAFVRAVGALEYVVAPSHTAATPYLAKLRPFVDWELMLVIGIFIGAWISARLSGDRKGETVPPLWERRFGPGKGRRYAWAFLSGFALIFGARLAGGCTSGHGISGSLQLAASGWLFFLTVFAAGIATAFAVYGKERRNV